MHDVGTVIENLHIGLQDVEMEGRGQHTTVAVPLVTSTQQEPIPWEGSMAMSNGEMSHTHLQGCP